MQSQAVEGYVGAREDELVRLQEDEARNQTEQESETKERTVITEI